MITTYLNLILFNLLLIFESNHSLLLANDNKTLIPKLTKSCLDGQCIKDQFYNIYRKNFAIVARNNINLRNKPNLNSDIIRTLPVSTYVTILYLDNIKQNINGFDGNWAFVKISDNQQAGWIFDYYLATPSKFKNVDTWNFKYIHYFSGDYNAHFTCDKLGLCNYKWTAGNSADFNKGNEDIQVLQYQNIIYFPKSKEDNFQIMFFLDESGLINIFKENFEPEIFKFETFEYYGNGN